MLTDEQQAALLAFDTYSNTDKHAVNRVMNSIRAAMRDTGIEPVPDNHEAARAMLATVIGYYEVSAGGLTGPEA